MSPRTPRAIALGITALLAVAALIPSAASEGTAPTPKFTVSFDPTVLSPITFDASASLGDGLTFAWDFDGDSLTDATGDIATWTYDAPGAAQVTLTVTDASEATATLTKTVLVDDFTTVTIELLEVPDLASSTLMRFTLTDWKGDGIADQDLAVRVFLQPVPGLDTSRILQDLVVNTGTTGTIDYPIPRDTALTNLPGTHFITAAHETNAGTFGNVERATAKLTYAIDL